VKAEWLILGLVLFSSSSLVAQQSRVTEQQVINYAKAIDVAKLDPKLTSQRLDKWLQSGPVHVDRVRWERSECDLKPVPAISNYVAPLCAKVRFFRGDCWGWIIITIGTFRDGITGTPHLEYISAEVGQNFNNPLGSNKLSDLPELLDKASSMKPH
jgi:hypothetical protein